MTQRDRGICGIQYRGFLSSHSFSMEQGKCRSGIILVVTVQLAALHVKLKCDTTNGIIKRSWTHNLFFFAFSVLVNR